MQGFSRQNRTISASGVGEMNGSGQMFMPFTISKSES